MWRKAYAGSGGTGGQIPVVAGVAATSEAAAVEHARHAAAAGADAVIALPSFLGAASGDEIASYYRAIAAAARRPVFIQHTFAGMGVDLINQLLDEVQEVQYVKEEMEPSAHQISALLAQVSANCRGVFGGGHGRWMLSELRRGATGFMPATEMTDLHRQIWDAWQEGDEQTARRLFNLLLPLINLIQLLGLRVCKELLVRRGVFASNALRMPGATRLDPQVMEAIGRVVDRANAAGVFVGSGMGGSADQIAQSLARGMQWSLIGIDYGFMLHAVNELLGAVRQRLPGTATAPPAN